jgi:pantetheine-phosphate adenylyltransferase
MNRKLDRDMETIFMMTGLRWFFVHSSGIKAAVKAGADVTGLVPDIVCEKLTEKLKV